MWAAGASPVEPGPPPVVLDPRSADAAGVEARPRCFASLALCELGTGALQTTHSWRCGQLLGNVHFGQDQLGSSVAEEVAEPLEAGGL